MSKIRAWMTSAIQWVGAGSALVVVVLLPGCAREPEARADLSVEVPVEQAVATASTPVPDGGFAGTVTAVGTIDRSVTPATNPPIATSESSGGAPVSVDASESTDAASSADAHAVVELTPEDIAAHQGEVDKLCAQIGDKLSSVETKDCLDQLFQFGGGHSINGRPLIFKDFMPVDPNDREFRVLMMGGVHGDEYSSISVIFKWLSLFSSAALEGEFHWRFAPLVNPDGLLDGKQAVRQNANGVDLNRNFPSEDWNATAVAYWQESTGSNPRRFPGTSAASEPEVQWIVEQIVDFQPDVIVSVHAPYHLLDFDGPAQAPRNIGELYLHQLGVYPGSLGNYAGLNKSIPVVTLELPSAGIMPKSDQIALMWKDLVAWLDSEGRSKLSN